MTDIRLGKNTFIYRSSKTDLVLIDFIHKLQK